MNITRHDLNELGSASYYSSLVNKNYEKVKSRLKTQLKEENPPKVTLSTDGLLISIGIKNIETIVVTSRLLPSTYLCLKRLSIRS